MKLSLICPTCSVEVFKITSVSPGEVPSDGDLFLCGDCAHLSIVEDKKLRSITAEEYKDLTPQERADLQFAARAIIGKAGQRLRAFAQTFLRNGN